MTREEAKSELMQIYMMLSEEKKMALDVLMTQADGEYISRQAVLDLCSTKDKYNLPYEYYEDGKHIRGWDEGRIINYSKLKLLPSVAIPNKTGHWIFHEIEDTLRWYECDQCGANAVREYDYCHGCGAKMD